MRAEHDRAKRLIECRKISAAGARTVDDEIFGRGRVGRETFRIDIAVHLPLKSAAFRPRRGVLESPSLMRHYRMRNPHDSFRDCEWRIDWPVPCDSISPRDAVGG
jgi:hypothetical protein